MLSVERPWFLMFVSYEDPAYFYQLLLVATASLAEVILVTVPVFLKVVFLDEENLD